ncbi:MAG: bifunctional phosphoglucose/phosphomannose isomerase [Chloroflexi bacterium]|nr:bifunctional phosphoglucose/phosphomannose isomerase [Chloroflexota bacterium]
MVDLDDLEIYAELDPSGLGGRIRQLPQQCRHAWELAQDFPLPSEYSQADKVVILGMGGSAIGGDLLGSLLELEGRTPLVVQRDYRLPPFVDAGTLVIACSYSGNTEETLSAFRQALDSPAKKLAITTGGQLRELCDGAGVPVLTFDYPSEPRSALGYSFIPLVGVCQKLALLPNKSRDVGEACAVLEELCGALDERSPMASNAAKQLASRLLGRLIVVYGAGILTQVAHRWKTQFNENSKAWAFHEAFPELNHNSVVGYEFPPELKRRLFVILLRSPLIHPRTLLRYKATSELLTQADVEQETIESTANSALAQMMSTILLGDYTSYYLAILNRVDPAPVRAIDSLKSGLAKA